MSLPTQRSRPAAAIAAVAFYALAWASAVFYLQRTGGDWTTPLFVMAIFGIALSGLAWLLTRGADAPAIAVERPRLEAAAVVAYIALYAVFFLGYGMSAARAAFPPGQAQESLVFGVKLLAHVALPVALLLLVRAPLAPLFQLGLSGRAFWRTLIVMGAAFLALLCVISPSLSAIQAEHPTFATLAWVAPVSFAWIAVEAGFNEEFLFRALLQTRLSALFQSPWAGVIVTSLLFGLAHAPGLFLRGGPGVDGWSTDPLQVIAHTIATLSPMGLLFGLIYARTKSLLLVALLHGLVDVLPNMADFIRTWA